LVAAIETRSGEPTALVRLDRVELPGQPEDFPLEELLPLQLEAPRGDPPAEVPILGGVDLADEVPEIAVLDRDPRQDLSGRDDPVVSALVHEEEVAQMKQPPFDFFLPRAIPSPVSETP